MRNPFTPTFGIVPTHLAGRDLILDQMGDAFDNGLGDPNLSTILIGPRGCGKTALLACIADEAQRRGWVSVTVAAAPGMLDDILQRTLEAASEFLYPDEKRRLTGINVAQMLGLEWSLEPREGANWRTRMTAVLEKLGEQDIGLLVNVDEVNVAVDEMVQLASTYQLFIGEGRKIALVMAGLPANTTDLVEDERISFLRRSRQRHLGLIPDMAVREALRNTVQEGGKEIDEHALARMVDASGGFAYMIQLVGYCTWGASGTGEKITPDHAEVGIAQAQEEFRTGVLETTVREMSAGDRLFASCMLADEGGSTLTDVARRMGKGTNYASTYKKRLMKQGAIYERVGGSFGFAIPGPREYLGSL